MVLVVVITVEVIAVVVVSVCVSFCGACVRACVRAYGLCVRRVRVVGVSRGVWVCRVWCVGALCVLCGRVVRGRAGVPVMV